MSRSPDLFFCPPGFSSIGKPSPLGFRFLLGIDQNHSLVFEIDLRKAASFCQLPDDLFRALNPALFCETLAHGAALLLDPELASAFGSSGYASAGTRPENSDQFNTSASTRLVCGLSFGKKKSPSLLAFSRQSKEPIGAMERLFGSALTRVLATDQSTRKSIEVPFARTRKARRLEPVLESGMLLLRARKASGNEPVILEMSFICPASGAKEGLLCDWKTLARKTGIPDILALSRLSAPGRSSPFLIDPAKAAFLWIERSGFKSPLSFEQALALGNCQLAPTSQHSALVWASAHLNGFPEGSFSVALAEAADRERIAASGIFSPKNHSLEEALASFLASLESFKIQANLAAARSQQASKPRAL